MFNIKLYYTFTGITAGNKVIAVWNTSIDPSKKDRKVFDGVVVKFNGVFAIDDLQPVTYEFMFYESTDGIALTAPISSDPLIVDPTVSNEEAVLINYYKVGSGENEVDSLGVPIWKTPEDGDDFLLDTRIKGATYSDLTINLQGEGDLHKEQFEIVDTGINLKQGLTFSLNQYVKIEWHPKQKSTAQPTISIPKIKEPMKFIDSNRDFGADMYGTNNYSSYNGVRLTTTFNDLANTPDTYSMFNTYTGDQRYWSFYFPNQTVWFMGKARNWIHLAKNEEIVFNFWNKGAWVAHYKGTYGLAGSKSFGEVAAENQILINQSHWDGPTQIPLYNIADYIRAIEGLQPSQITSLYDYDYSDAYIDAYELGKRYHYYPHRAKFAVDYNAGTFKFPSVGGLFMKFVVSVEASSENIVTDFTLQTNRLTQGFASIEPNRMLRHAHRPRSGQGGNRTNSISNITGFSGMDSNSGWAKYDNLIELNGYHKNVVDNFGQALII